MSYKPKAGDYVTCAGQPDAIFMVIHESPTGKGRLLIEPVRDINGEHVGGAAIPIEGAALHKVPDSNLSSLNLTRCDEGEIVKINCGSKGQAHYFHVDARYPHGEIEATRIYDGIAGKLIDVADQIKTSSEFASTYQPVSSRTVRRLRLKTVCPGYVAPKEVPVATSAATEEEAVEVVPTFPAAGPAPEFEQLNYFGSKAYLVKNVPKDHPALKDKGIGGWSGVKNAWIVPVNQIEAVKVALLAEAAEATPSKGTTAPAKKAVVPDSTDFQVDKTDGAIVWPKCDKNFHVPKRTEVTLESIAKLSERKPVNTVAIGPRGCGKTELAWELAARSKRPLLYMNCSVIRENKEWFGYKDVKGGSIIWQQAEFVRAVQMENCVIVLDEFNRMHATVQNAVLPLLDSRRSTYIDDMKDTPEKGIIKVAKGVIFFATCNVGAEYTGTFQLDAAMDDRFSYVLECSYLPKEAEEQVLTKRTGVDRKLANRLVQLANNVRAKACGTGSTLSRAISTRHLLALAEMLVLQGEPKGMDMLPAMEAAVLSKYPDDGGKESERAQVLTMMKGIFDIK